MSSQEVLLPSNNKKIGIIAVIIVIVFTLGFLLTLFILVVMLSSADKPKVCKRKTTERQFCLTKEELNLTNAVPTIDGQPCGQDSEHLIVVYSAARTSGKYFDLRVLDRETWGSQAKIYNIRVIFLLALNKNHTVNEDLKKEANQYNDIIQFSFIDSRENLTLKNIATLRWLRRQCPQVKTVLKTDDDIIINVDLLNRSWNQFKSGYSGHKFARLSVNRNNTAKDKPLYMPEEYYPGNTWPDFLGGGAYVFTSDVIDKMLTTLDAYKNYVLDYIDNIFITGIIAQEAGVARFKDKRFQVYHNCDPKSRLCGICQEIAVIDCVDIDQFRYFWEEWTRPNSSCSCRPKF